MIKYIVVTEKGSSSVTFSEDRERLIVSSSEFLANTIGIDWEKQKNIKVINLCRNFSYLGKGYYTSLIAEARGLRCVPSVANIIALKWKRNFTTHLPELNDLIEKNYNDKALEPRGREYTTFFGRHNHVKLEPITRRLFDIFRFPVLAFKIELSSKNKWQLTEVEPVSLNQLTAEQLSEFQVALDKFTGTAWRQPTKSKRAGKKWVAILHDPKEKYCPSNKAALKKFISAGEALGLNVELITKNDYASLLEYDALFIRETTAINNHTYRFALKAYNEGIPCIDDINSIIRCCNKVFLHELLKNKGVSVPETVIIDQNTDLKGEQFSYPAVVKVPDGSFSRGMFKVTNEEELKVAVKELLKKSEILLCQKFITSAYDWRIGILDGKPLFANKYFMAAGHWQIYNHDAKEKKNKEGDANSYAIDDVPKDVLNAAIKAASYIGNGLYGVDLKQTDDGIYVIEVNDNPNIDHGVEDEYLGDAIYKMVMENIAERCR